MASIRTYRNSTPTFTYNVTGADEAGIDLDKMAIGMTLSWDNFTAYILPAPEVYDFFDITEGATVVAYRDNRYCRHINGTNSFSITLPLWRLSSSLGDEATYQVFLFNRETLSLIGGDDENIRPAIMQPINIVIDAGSFVLYDSLVPPIIGSVKPIIGSVKRNEKYISLV